MNRINDIMDANDVEPLIRMRVDSNSRICRVCRIYSESMEDLFLTNSHGYVAAKAVEELFVTKVVAAARYPRFLCMDCLRRLTDLKKFRELYLQSRCIFEKGINTYNVSTNVVHIVCPQQEEAESRIPDNVEDSLFTVPKKEFPIDRYDQWGNLLHEEANDEQAVNDSGVDSTTEETITEESTDHFERSPSTGQTVQQTDEPSPSEDDFFMERLKLEDDDAEVLDAEESQAVSSVSGNELGNELGSGDRMVPCSMTNDMPIKSVKSSNFSIETIKTAGKSSKSNESQKKKRFTCAVCNYSAFYKYVLTIHMLRHTGYKPYKCEMCPKAFNRRYLLKVHIKNHLGVKEYKCDGCKKSFVTLAVLNAHKRIHSDVRPFKCKVCSKGFVSKSNFDCHILVHTKLKPFPCNECNGSFRTKRNLRLHKLMHSDVKPYSCEKCGKKYRLAAYLKTHRCREELEIRCNRCGKVVMGRGNMFQHERACKRKSRSRNKFSIPKAT